MAIDNGACITQTLRSSEHCLHTSVANAEEDFCENQLLRRLAHTVCSGMTMRKTETKSCWSVSFARDEVAMDTCINTI